MQKILILISPLFCCTCCTSNAGNNIYEAKPKIFSRSCYPVKTCSELSSCQEAMYRMQRCGQHQLDRDSDGIPCEWTLCNN